MVEYIAEVCRAEGFSIQFFKYSSQGLTQANLVISNQKIKNLDFEIILQGHIDTIEPGHYTLWHKTGKNPFAATIHEGNIYGLGVADCKLDVLCKIIAAQKFLNSNLKKTFAVLITSGKETGFRGAVDILRKEKLRSKYALVGVPTNLDLVLAGKGLAKLEIDIPFTEDEIKFKFDHDHLESVSTESRFFSGVSSHYSQPELGVNAIEKMFDYLENMPDNIMVMEVEGGLNDNSVPLQAVLEFAVDSSNEYKTLSRVKNIYNYIKDFKVKTKKYRDDRFVPSTTTFNIARVETLEDRIRIKGSVSWPPAVSMEVYQSWIKEMKSVCEDNDSKISFTDYIKPYEMPTDSHFAQTLLSIAKKQNLNTKIATHSDTSEAHCFSRFGIETIAFGPGHLADNSQTPEESVKISDLEESIKFYETVIENFCS